MMYIRETVPLKYSGLSSFLVTSTEFNPDLKTAMDGVTQQYYSKKYKHWEVPQECLAETLDALTFIDNIQLIMLPPEDVLPKQEGFELTETEIRLWRMEVMWPVGKEVMENIIHMARSNRVI